MVQPPAFRPIHIENNSVVGDPVNNGGSQDFITDKLLPFGELQIRCVKSAGRLVARADNLKKQAGGLLIVIQVADLINNQ